MIRVKATVVSIEKPAPPKAAPPVLKISGVRAVVKGPDYDEVMRWRAGVILTKEDKKIKGFRKILLGSPEYRVNGKEFPAEQVYAFRRDEYICQPHQSYDPQAYTS